MQVKRNAEADFRGLIQTRLKMEVKEQEASVSHER